MTVWWTKCGPLCFVDIQTPQGIEQIFQNNPSGTISSIKFFSTYTPSHLKLSLKSKRYIYEDFFQVPMKKSIFFTSNCWNDQSWFAIRNSRILMEFHLCNRCKDLLVIDPIGLCVPLSNQSYFMPLYKFVLKQLKWLWYHIDWEKTTYLFD